MLSDSQPWRLNWAEALVNVITGALAAVIGGLILQFLLHVLCGLHFRFPNWNERDWSEDSVIVRPQGVPVVIRYWVMNPGYRWKRGSSTIFEHVDGTTAPEVPEMLGSLLEHKLENADAIISVGTASQEFVADTTSSPEKLEQVESQRAQDRAETLQKLLDSADDPNRTRMHYWLVLGRYSHQLESQPIASRTSYQRRIIVMGVQSRELRSVPRRDIETALRNAMLQSDRLGFLRLKNYHEFTLMRVD